MTYFQLSLLMLSISFACIAVCHRLDRIARAIERAHGITGETK